MYVDNAANRRMGRVGMPLGSMVQSQSPKKTDRAKDMARVWDYVHNDLVRPTTFVSMIQSRDSRYYRKLYQVSVSVSAFQVSKGSIEGIFRHFIK